MGHGKKKMDPASLYITIATPRLPPHQNQHLEPYLSYVPQFFDPGSYETGCAHGIGTEEFEWGLYWYDAPGSGTWYTLSKVEKEPELAKDEHGNWHKLPSPPSYTLVQHNIPPSHLRLDKRVVGMIQVLSIPIKNDAELSPYLDWLTDHTSKSATRTFIWAASAYLRCRLHVAKIHRTTDEKKFEVKSFLCEALGFAYGEVWYGLGGQLPRPVMVSEYGAHLVMEMRKKKVVDERSLTEKLLDEHRKLEERKRSNTLEVQEWPPLPLSQTTGCRG